MENFIKDYVIHALATNGPQKLQQCKLLGVAYVQGVVHILNP